MHPAFNSFPAFLRAVLWPALALFCLALPHLI